MQIVLQIDATTLKDTVVETISNMSEENRQELAKQAVTEYLKNFSEDKETIRRMAIPEFKEYNGKNSIYVNNRYTDIDNCNESQILNSNKFKRWFDNVEHRLDLKSQVRLQIANEITGLVKKSVLEVISQDDSVKQTIDKVVEEFKVNLPKFIESAMTLHFTKQIGEIFSSSAVSLETAMNSNQQIQEMNKRLLQKGI